MDECETAHMQPYFPSIVLAVLKYMATSAFSLCSNYFSNLDTGFGLSIVQVYLSEVLTSLMFG